MKHIHPNILNLMATAQALKEIKDLVVFVGGATTTLYVDQSDRTDARSTVDVDCVIEATSTAAFQKIESRIRELGFKNDISEDTPICRWTKHPLVLDLMPIDEKILGFSNRWYQDGFKNSETVTLPDNSQIQTFSLIYFVASKTEALLARGIDDLSISQDFVDLLFVIEGRKSFFDEIRTGPQKIQQFLRTSFDIIRRNDSFDMSFRGNLPRGLTQERQNQVLEVIKNL